MRISRHLPVITELLQVGSESGIHLRGLGLLLAFSPCCLPMVPILSGIIAGQGVYLCSGEERMEISYQGYDHFGA